jgi:HK97 gp10 family phage protein
VRAALRPIADEVATQEKARVPVLTGALRRSIKVRTVRRRARLLVVATARHADLIEFGTRQMMARPYARPALRAVAPRAPGLFGVGYRLTVERAARRAGLRSSR